MKQGSSPLRPGRLRRRVLCAASSVAIAVLAADSAAQTLVHRCITPGGDIEFRQHPCADGSNEHALTIEDRKSGWVPPAPRTKANTKDKKDLQQRNSAARADAARTRRREQCWKKRQLLDEVNWKLRRGYKPGKGVELRRKRRSYEDYITRYCD